MWDARVLQKWIEYGLRDVPTPLEPNTQPPKVTLTTTPAQEVFTFLRPNYEGYGVNGKPVDRSTHADIDTKQELLYPFYRAEAPKIFQRLPEVRPSVLYLFGETSTVSLKPTNDEKLAMTGTGPGGSGGAKEGRVKGVTFAGVGHLIAMEAVEKTADATAEWVGAEIARFRREQEAWETGWKLRGLEQKQQLDETWREMVGGSPRKAKI